MFRSVARRRALRKPEFDLRSGATPRGRGHGDRRGNSPLCSIVKRSCPSIGTKRCRSSPELRSPENQETLCTSSFSGDTLLCAQFSCTVPGIYFESSCPTGSNLWPSKNFSYSYLLSREASPYASGTAFLPSSEARASFLSAWRKYSRQSLLANPELLGDFGKWVYTGTLRPRIRGTAT